jgi:exopolysaccharide biosynthesis polyprenyl glycosylphosphotransferase
MTNTATYASHLRLEFSERKLLLRLGDLLLIVVGMLGALALWSQFAQRPLDGALLREQLSWAAAIGVGWLLCLVALDMYDLRRVVQLRWCLRRLVLSAFVIGVLYIAYFFVAVFPLSAAAGVIDPAPSATPLRLAPVISVLAIALLLIIWRAIYAVVLGGIHARRRVLILGAGSAGRTFIDVLLAYPHFEMVGFVDDDPRKLGSKIYSVPVLGGHEKMLDVVESRGVDEIIIAISAAMKGSLFQTIMDCHERGITITPMPLLYEQLTGKVAVEHIGSQWYVALPFENNGFDSLTRLAKRGLDILLGSLMALVFLLTLPIVALAIRLDSKGPIFYAQERMGLHGKVFKVVKYRSMVEDAERDGKAKWATKGDPRITRVGRFMRKTRIDELPQVINILRGEMSMVGPRPERPQFIEKLQKQIPFYRTRLAAKPGLTGWAQVSYGYGATTEDALIKLQYDLYYLKHQSVWFDLKILLRTIAVVLKMKGQ